MKLFATILAAATVFAVGARVLPAVAQSNAQTPPTDQSSKQKGSGRVENPVDVQQRQFTPGNFRVNVGDLTRAVNKFDSLTVKQTTTTDNIGQERDYATEPGSAPPRLSSRVTMATTLPPVSAVVKQAPSSDDDDDNDDAP